MIELFKRRSEFEQWLSEMEPALTQFLNSLPDVVRRKLDFSPESLDAVERWILENYANYQLLMTPEHRITWDGLARYIGETYRRQLGGHWETNLDDPKYVWYRLPFLRFGTRTTSEGPHATATAAIDRRTGNYIRTVLENTKHQEAKWK